MAVDKRSRWLGLLATVALLLLGLLGARLWFLQAVQAADYQAKVTSLHTQLQAAEDRADVLEAEQKGRRNDELFSTAGSILGDLFGGRKSRGGMLGSVFGKAGTAAGKRGRTAASGERLDAAENKIQLLHQQMEDLAADLAQEVTDIDAKWMNVAKDITTVPIPLEKSDVKVTQLCLVWIPVA